MKFPKPFSKPDHHLNVIIETPAKSRNKFAYDKNTGLYKLSKVIPGGLQFPFDMGFIPRTKGQDNDPLDALVFMNELTYPGCLVECHLLGVMKILQTKDKKTIRNDRFLAVPVKADEYDHIRKISDINKETLSSIMNFFSYYNGKEEKVLKLIGYGTEKEAQKLIKHAG
jgi:inorganic pyrophosphatase